MDRSARLQSARNWLAERDQRGRPAIRILRSYRKRYGVDWECAVLELSQLGITFDAKWREEHARALKPERDARIRREADKLAERQRAAFPMSDCTFAFIAGYTEGGAPFGITWEEWKQMEVEKQAEKKPPADEDNGPPDEPPPKTEPPMQGTPPVNPPPPDADDSLPF